MRTQTIKEHFQTRMSKSTHSAEPIAVLDTLGAVSRREQKQQIFWEQSYQKVQIGYRKEPKFSSSAKVKKEAKLARKVLPQAKYHPKRHLSKQKPNLSWIRTGVDKKPNLCDRSGHKSSKTLWQKSSQNPQEVHKCAEVSHFEIEAKQRRSRPFWNWSQTKTSRPFWIHVKQRRLITSVF